jgi:2-oxoglutarate dehydrogenase E2 component (dihydrolipoamide succinyltransferase)
MSAIDIVAPAEQEGTKAVVKTWLKRVGDSVSVDDPIVELETDKVAVEVAATADGVLAEILLSSGAEVEPGMVLGRIAPHSATRRSEETRETPLQRPSAINAKRAVDAQIPPGIRRMLSEHGLSAGDVPFAGERLTREDVQAEIDRRARHAKPATEGACASPST